MGQWRIACGNLQQAQIDHCEQRADDPQRGIAKCRFQPAKAVIDAQRQAGNQRCAKGETDQALHPRFGDVGPG